MTDDQTRDDLRARLADARQSPAPVEDDSLLVLRDDLEAEHAGRPNPRHMVHRATRTADGASLTASVRNARILSHYRTPAGLSKNVGG